MQPEAKGLDAEPDPFPPDDDEPGDAPEFAEKTVEISLSRLDRVSGQNVRFAQGLAKAVDGQNVDALQSATLLLTGDSVQMMQGGALVIHSDEAQIVQSKSLAAVASRLHLEQGAGKWLFAREANLRQSGVMVMVANTLRLSNSRAGIVLARRIEGEVHCLVSQRAAVGFGAAFGALLGLFLVIRRLVGTR